MMIKRRDIAMSIIFSIITLGLYRIYWLIKLTDEINFTAQRYSEMSGVTTFIWCIITCDIFYFYWIYDLRAKMDKYIDVGKSKKVLYLFFSFFLPKTVVCALLQSSLNRFLPESEEWYLKQVFNGKRNLTENLLTFFFC